MSFLLCLGALVLSYALYLPSLALSYAAGAIDYPTKRKTHAIPTARGGGFSFFTAFSVALLVSPVSAELKIALLVGGSVIFLVGFFDDCISLSPPQKLAGQFAAAATYIFISGSDNLLLGFLTLAWTVYLTNAINLTDGLDGLAGGICSGEALCLAIIALVFGHTDVTLAASLLLFAVIGFLPRNFPHAKIFMGDCGALFLGFTLAVLSSRLVSDSGSLLCLFSVLLVFRLPTYDTNISIIRRSVRGKNPFRADKEHFHHKLLALGFTKECAALALITASLALGFVGVIISTL